jgi:hypothetical protein
MTTSIFPQAADKILTHERQKIAEQRNYLFLLNIEKLAYNLH